ncbi:hypothetical protein LCGC14_1962990 [marine sediment metagenome]|uniref:Uncharacterized protein n=1 Tax=marine sediment metagenome TaxID=412755 RepID=A0A0F9G2D3_9ZZZZ
MMNSEGESDFGKYLTFISKEFKDRIGLHEKINRKIEKLKRFRFNNKGSSIEFSDILKTLKKIRLDRINFLENLLKILPELERGSKT